MNHPSRVPEFILQESEKIPRMVSPLHFRDFLQVEVELGQLCRASKLASDLLEKITVQLQVLEQSVREQS